MSGPRGYWPSPWPGEDGGPDRRQAPHRGTGFDLRRRPGARLRVSSRQAIASTMVVLRDPGEVYLLRHSVGGEPVSWVEQIDPVTLDTVRRSPDLPGGPPWPGGIACHENGSLYVVFGCHAHRLSNDLQVLASATLPRERPYNSFVILPDGHLATKDFAGRRTGVAEPDGLGPSELVVLEPDQLDVVARQLLPEPSIARLSLDGSDIYVVADTSVWRVRWDGTGLHLDPSYRAVYRTLPGQTFGWDAVIDSGAAWFLDNGEGSERYQGTFHGLGSSSSPLHLVHVHLSTGEVMLSEICGLPGGLVANPPVLDPVRRMVVGYDSGNGVVTGFRVDTRGVTSPLWTRRLEHAAHPLRFPDTGELVLFDYDLGRRMEQVVIVDIETGDELARTDTGSAVQGVLFAAPGFADDLYVCTFTTLSRVEVVGR